MEKSIKNKRKFSLYVYYTVFFAIAAAVCFSFFALYNKSMIYKNDGLYTFYNAFVYFGQWERDIISGIIFDHNFVIPMWEWGMGPGEDIVRYGLLSDPFFLFSVFFPSNFAEIGYDFFVILRLYLVGFAFCAYCKKMNCVKWTTVCASIMYTFCAFTIYAAPRDPHFVNTMIFLPLIFLGCEKIFRNESFVPFSLSVAITAFSGFYFFYVIIILTVLYVIVRLLNNSEYRHLKFILNKVGKLLIFSIIGVAISCVLLLPTIMTVAESNPRISDTYTFNFLYSKSEYSILPGSFVNATKAATLWAVVGMAPLVYIGVFGSVANRDKNQRFARIYLLIEIIFLLFPVFGHIMNGFGYVTNRWVFAWPFMPSFLFAKEFPAIINFENRKKIRLCLGCIGYTVLCVVLEHSRVEDSLVGLVFLLLSLIFVCFASEIIPISIDAIRIKKISISIPQKIVISKKRIIQAITVLMTLCFVFNIAYYRYSENENNYLSDYRDKNVSNELLTNEAASAWTLINDDDFYRIDNSFKNDSQDNFPYFSHQPTTTSYSSLNSGEYVAWRQLNSAYTKTNYLFDGGLLSRAWLEPLYCAKYFVSTSGAAARAYIPYGYELQGNTEGYSKKYYLYKTDNSLPFGYTYDSFLYRSDFEKLSIVERQQASLQSCVIEDNAEVSISTASQNFDDYEIQYNLKCDKNVTYDDNVLHVKSNDATVELTFESPTVGELYVLFSGLDFRSASTSTVISANCGTASFSVNHYTEKNIYAEGRTEYLLNLGYSEDERNKITVKFSKKGDYSFDELKVICQPMEKLSEYVKARSENSLENVEFTTNKISGTIDLEESKLLCLSLPYSKGWTAYVDGERADLLNTNIAFSGLMLEPGHHEIKLTYCTPYIKIGALLSVLGVICIIVGGIMFKHKEWVVDKINSLKKRIKNIKVSDSDQD